MDSPPLPNPPTQSPQPTTGPVPTPSPQPSSSKNTLLYLLIALLLAALGYLGYQNWQLQQQVNRFEAIIKVDNTPSDFTSPMPSPSLDSTASWKTYNLAGISFKFPPSWLLDPGGKKITSSDPEIDIVVFGKDDPMYNECMEQKDIKEINSLMVKYFSHVQGTEACSNPETWNEREVWITKSTGDGYQPGIIFYYKSEEENGAVTYFNQILSTFEFTNNPVDDKIAVNSALSGYLNALTTGNCDLARSYLTTAASAEYQDVECNNKFTSWESLNEFHSSEEESKFYNQQQIIFDIKLYQTNDQIGTPVKVGFQKENNQWKTDAWFMNQ